MKKTNLTFNETIGKLQLKKGKRNGIDKPLHTQGETNIRLIKKGGGCPVCGRPIEKGDGYKVVTSSDFYHVHKKCLYKLETGVVKASEPTKVPMGYKITVTAKIGIVNALVTNQWKRTNTGIVSVYMENTNPLKVLNAFSNLSQVVVSVTNYQTGKKEKLVFHHVDGEEVTRKVDDVGKKLGKYQYKKSKK